MNLSKNTPNTNAVLIVDNLYAWYGKTQVLHGISFEIGEGEIVALLGRNGSGRSTTAKAIMGLVQRQGRMDYRGQPIDRKRPFEIARMGVGYVPEGRDVFGSLTVEQNLLRAHRPSWASWGLPDAYALFPILSQRAHVPASALSGGEQQMLAVCRTLMMAPDLLIIDEPTEGLAPQMVVVLKDCLQSLKARGVSVLLIEQKLSLALAVADRVLVMGRGQVVFCDTPMRFSADPSSGQPWLQSG